MSEYEGVLERESVCVRENMRELNYEWEIEYERMCERNFEWEYVCESERETEGERM